MREPWTIPALILAAACACEPSPAPPPVAPPAVVPVSPASAAPLAVEPAPAPAPSSASETDAPTELAPLSEPDGPPPPLPSAGAPPFDRGRAAAALGAVNVQACANGTGPRGVGHVRITFATSGHVRAVVLDQGPFIATPTGDCILARFRAVQVPPFSGPEVNVGKSFSLK